MFIGVCGTSLRAGFPGSKGPRCGAAAQSARNAGLLLHGGPAASSLSRRLVCRHGHRRFAGGTNFAGCQFGPCSIRRERQPNNSLKRTVQSLRDWSCRLAHALAGRRWTMGLRIVRASAKPLTHFSVGAPTAASGEKLLEQQGDRTRRKMLLRQCGCLAGSRVLLRRLRRWWG